MADLWLHLNESVIARVLRGRLYWLPKYRYQQAFVWGQRQEYWDRYHVWPVALLVQRSDRGIAALAKAIADYFYRPNGEKAE
jgi:hypothetical protein